MNAANSKNLDLIMKKQYVILNQNNSNIWIRKSKKSEITIGDEIYLFNRNKLLVVCNDFCNKGTRPVKKDFCKSDCKFQNGGGSSKKI
jgi:hypothetical protein